MKPRYLALLLVGMLVGALLVACAPEAAPSSGGGEQGGTTQQPAEEEEQAPTQAEGKVYKWDLQSIWPAGFQSHVECDRAIQKMNAASGGRLDITLQPAGASITVQSISLCCG